MIHSQEKKKSTESNSEIFKAAILTMRWDIKENNGFCPSGADNRNVCDGGREDRKVFFCPSADGTLKYNLIRQMHTSLATAQ